VQVLKRIILLLTLATSLSGCLLKPIDASDLDQSKVGHARAAIEAFRTNPALADFFDKAAVIAVYPNALRAGGGFGGAWARGLVFRDDMPIAHGRMLQFSAGANVGGQWYRQILFFKTVEAWEAFAKAPLEFAGQANAAVATVGLASTPSFNSEVALFTELKGGLLFEASVGAHRYGFAPITRDEGR
jgi:lipid-binding SYLF domain-containing protein